MPAAAIEVVLPRILTEAIEEADLFSVDRTVAEASTAKLDKDLLLSKLFLNLLEIVEEKFEVRGTRFLPPPELDDDCESVGAKLLTSAGSDAILVTLPVGGVLLELLPDLDTVSFDSFALLPVPLPVLRTSKSSGDGIRSRGVLLSGDGTRSISQTMAAALTRLFETVSKAICFKKTVARPWQALMS